MARTPAEMMFEKTHLFLAKLSSAGLCYVAKKFTFVKLFSMISVEPAKMHCKNSLCALHLVVSVGRRKS
jgi:hypothetical protein